MQQTLHPYSHTFRQICSSSITSSFQTYTLSQKHSSMVRILQHVVAWQGEDRWPATCPKFNTMEAGADTAYILRQILHMIIYHYYSWKEVRKIHHSKESHLCFSRMLQNKQTDVVTGIVSASFGMLLLN